MNRRSFLKAAIVTPALSPIIGVGAKIFLPPEPKFVLWINQGKGWETHAIVNPSHYFLQSAFDPDEDYQRWLLMGSSYTKQLNHA